MSNKIIKGMIIQIGADTLGLDKALKDVETKSKTASSELREINSAIKITGDSTALWEQKQKLLNDALEKSKEKVKILEDAQKGFTERFRNGEIDKGTYDKFQEKLTKSRDKLKELKSQQEQIEAKFKSGEIDQGEYDKFRAKVEKAEKQVKDLETAEHSMEENLRLGNISEEQYRAFQRETEYARTAVKKYEDELKEANQKVIELGNESDNTADDVKELGEKADHTASGGISAMTVALGNLIADGIKKAGSELKDFTKDIIQTGADFEAAMSNVAAISGADKAGLEQLTAKAEEMGATTKFTAKESADAFQYMAMAGWKTEDMLGGIEGIMDLAAASGEDLAITSDIVTDALTAFGLTAADSGHFADVLAAASSNANTNVAMMGETFKYVAPIAGALNFSVEDTAEAIGLMANSGIKASQAGTSLRAILTAMSGANEKASSAFQELNVETLNADGSMRGLNEILGDLRTSWQGLTEAEQADYAQRIAGKEAMSGFLSLVNAAPADIDKLSGAIRDCDGAASDMSTTMVDNLQGDMTILGSAIDGMKISLSKKLNPALRDVTQYVTSKMPEIEKGLEKVGGKAIKVLDFSVKNLPKAIDFLKKSMPVIKGVGAAFLTWKIAEKAKPGAKALGELFSSVKSGNSIMKIFFTTLKAHPIGAVTTAIGVATTAIDYFRSKAKRKEEDRRESLAAFIKDEYKEAAERINDTSDSLKNMKDSFNEQAGTIEAETQRTKDLWGELQTLADESGYVKDADKTRADYILGELNDALGTEYTMTGDQIENYKTMRTEIDKLIEKKRALAYIDAYGADMVEYGKIRAQSIEELANAQLELNKLENRKEGIGYEAAAIAGRNFSLDELVDLYNRKDSEKWVGINAPYLENTQGSDPKLIEDRKKQLLKLAEEAVAYDENYDLAQKNLETAKANYEAAVEYFQRLEKAEDAVEKGNYDLVGQILFTDQQAIQQIYKDIDKASKDEIERRKQTWEEYLEARLISLKTALDAEDKETARQQAGLIKEALKSGDAAGFTGGTSYKNRFKTVVEQMRLDDIDTSEFVEFGGRSGDSFMSGFVAKIQALNAINDSGNFFGNAISGAFDAISSLPMFAKGGFLGSGQGIVAEAGPELIEIMNGGAKITPLTGNARNTAVSGADGNRNKVVYINNTINASVSGSYDVRRLAEDLASEQRRIERNMGL